MKLSKTAKAVLEKRYLLKNAKGKIVETPEAMFRRVAKEVAKADLKYGHDSGKSEKKFLDVMMALDFLPNSPTLMNAGTSMGQLSACFVLPIEDSMESIFDALKNMALIHQSGGGVGFSFSKLRAEGSIVKTSKGIASGPVSFMKIFDVATDVIKQGGRRRGANMGILNVEHPDILKFVNAKEMGGFPNFNLSAGISDKFMKNPDRKVFDSIVQNAW
ncbi:ribonucleoside-diphosphate reductase, adenosylcobalamin-dependent, partial [Candidatus Woesearchaeota archaeon]|nr:ribonucleoside-diphosphate reductase, adenosylcobalamin-dependent [Candidatus Woesearchaeota archaeon]